MSHSFPTDKHHLHRYLIGTVLFTILGLASINGILRYIPPAGISEYIYLGVYGGLLLAWAFSAYFLYIAYMEGE